MFRKVLYGFTLAVGASLLMAGAAKAQQGASYKVQYQDQSGLVWRATQDYYALTDAQKVAESIRGRPEVVRVEIVKVPLAATPVRMATGPGTAVPGPADRSSGRVIVQPYQQEKPGPASSVPPSPQSNNTRVIIQPYQQEKPGSSGPRVMVQQAPKAPVAQKPQPVGERVIPRIERKEGKN